MSQKRAKQLRKHTPQPSAPSSPERASAPTRKVAAPVAYVDEIRLVCTTTIDGKKKYEPFQHRSIPQARGEALRGPMPLSEIMLVACEGLAQLAREWDEFCRKAAQAKDADLLPTAEAKGPTILLPGGL